MHESAKDFDEIQEAAEVPCGSLKLRTDSSFSYVGCTLFGRNSEVKEFDLCFAKLTFLQVD